jgi:hypothetical protein
MTMSKRPIIKGRGADIYLGGDSKGRSASHQTASEAAKVSERVDSEKVFGSFAPFGESLCSLEGAKKAGAWYIENSEKLANQTIELQEKSMGWVKETPLAPLLEAQMLIARKFVECSASAMRSLWQIDSHHQNA